VTGVKITEENVTRGNIKKDRYCTNYYNFV